MTTSNVRKKLAAERRMHNVTIANLTAVEAKLAAAQDEIAALRERPCIHVRTSGTTSWCELARRDSAIKQEQTPGWFDPHSHGRGGI